MSKLLDRGRNTKLISNRTFHFAITSLFTLSPHTERISVMQGMLFQRCNVQKLCETSLNLSAETYYFPDCGKIKHFSRTMLKLSVFLSGNWTFSSNPHPFPHFLHLQCHVIMLNTCSVRNITTKYLMIFDSMNACM